MGKKVKKGFVPALHLFMGLIAMILVLLILMQLLGLLNTDLKKSIDSTAALTFAVSCSADKDNKIDISWSSLYSVGSVADRSISCSADQCCPSGKVNGANPFGETSVSCENVGLEEKPEYSCEVKNFQLPQVVKASGDPKAWTDPLFWIKGVGAPKYMVYYESFPTEEMQPFLKMTDDNLIPYMIIGGALSAVPWDFVGAKASIGLGKVFKKAGSEWISNKLVNFGTKRLDTFWKQFVKPGKVVLDSSEKEIVDNIKADDFLDEVYKEAPKLTDDEAAAVTKAVLNPNFFKEGAIRSAMATSGKVAGTKAYGAVKERISSGFTGLSDDAVEKLSYSVTEEALAAGKKVTSENVDEFTRAALGSVDEATYRGIKETLGVGDDEIAERLGKNVLDMEKAGLLTDSLDNEVAELAVKGGLMERLEEGAAENFRKYMKEPLKSIDDALKDGLQKAGTRFDKAGFKTGIKNILGEAKPLLSSPEFMQSGGMQKAIEISKTLARSKSVQYLLAEDIEDAFLKDLEGDYAPYAEQASDFAQCTAIVGYGAVKSSTCAALIALGMLQQTADNYNLPQEPVGINTIGLKPPFLPPYKFNLDKDAIQKYVALEKVNYYRGEGKKTLSDILTGGKDDEKGWSNAHVRLSLASPCKGSLYTVVGAVQCALPRCGEVIENAKKQICEGKVWEIEHGSLDDCRKEGLSGCDDEKWTKTFKSKDLCRLSVELSRNDYCGTVPESVAKNSGNLTKARWYTSYKYGEETIKADYPVAIEGLNVLLGEGETLDKDASGYKECPMPPDTLESIGGAFSGGLQCAGDVLGQVFSGGFKGCAPRDPVMVDYSSVLVGTIDGTVNDDGNGNYCTAKVDEDDAVALVAIHGASIGVSIAAPMIATAITGGAAGIVSPLISSGINFAMGAATVWLENEFVNPDWPKR